MLKTLNPIPTRQVEPRPLLHSFICTDWETVGMAGECRRSSVLVRLHMVNVCLRMNVCAYWCVGVCMCVQACVQKRCVV